MIAQYSGPDRKLEYLFQHAKEVSLSPILTTGTPLATLTIDDQTYTLYCTTGGGGGGSTVSYNSLITSGTALGELTIDGIAYTIYSKDSSKVAYSATQTSGTQIGTLTIDGTPHILYAPNSGGGGSVYAETDLWTGSGNMYTSLSITLSDAYTNYDALRFEYASVRGDSQNVPVHYEKTINKETLTTTNRFSISDFYLWNNVGVNVSGQFVDSTHLTTYLEAYSWFTSCTLTKIVGIKYGSGGLSRIERVTLSSTVMDSVANYTLSEAYTNFDFIELWKSSPGHTNSECDCQMIGVPTLKDMMDQSRTFTCVGYGTRFLHLTISGTTLSISTLNDLNLIKIIGVRFI